MLLQLTPNTGGHRVVYCTAAAVAFSWGSARIRAASPRDEFSAATAIQHSMKPRPDIGKARFALIEAAMAKYAGGFDWGMIQQTRMIFLPGRSDRAFVIAGHRSPLTINCYAWSGRSVIHPWSALLLAGPGLVRLTGSLQRFLAQDTGREPYLNPWGPLHLERIPKRAAADAAYSGPLVQYVFLVPQNVVLHEFAGIEGRPTEELAPSTQTDVFKNKAFAVGGEEEAWLSTHPQRPTPAEKRPRPSKWHRPRKPNTRRFSERSLSTHLPPWLAVDLCDRDFFYSLDYPFLRKCCGC